MSEDLSNLTQRIALIEDKVARIDHIINGNGQPGLASKIEKLITQISLLMQRLDHLENSAKQKKTDWQWVATALIALAAIIVQIIK